ncbi:MAG: VRR-NUC domain-containing protein [Myxococcota bacterium]
MNPAVSDLHDVLDRGLDRGGHLLTAGERRIVARMRSLEGCSALAWARLTTRLPRVFEVDRLAIADVDDVPEALERLSRAGLVDGLVPWPARAAALRKDDLVAALQQLGKPSTGRRDVLLERLRGERGFTRSRFVRVRHRGLVRRLERWALLEPFPDRATLVLDRLGVVRWPEYATTGGALLPPTRARWLAYERLLDRLGGRGPPLTPHLAIDALRDGLLEGPGRLDMTRRLRTEVLDTGHAYERDGRADEARELYRRLVEEGGARLSRVAFRWAQALMAEDRTEDAWGVLVAARPQAGPVERMAILRATRRIARKLGRSTAPDPPLRQPPLRDLRLERFESEVRSVRPRWGADGRTVEGAVCGWLGEQGRNARFGERRPFTTLFALLFADVLFMPVPGALPVRYLTRPLDFGTAAFRARRADAIEEVWQRIERGKAVEQLRDAWARWHGVRVVGARWGHAALSELEVLADHLGPRGLHAILDPLVDHGLSRTAGLPDLVVWPGRPVRLPDAMPSRLTGELHLVEIKGPGDRLRDAQRLWLDRLLEAGVRAELWEVSGAR